MMIYLKKLNFSCKALYKSHQSFSKNLTFYNCVVDENAYFYKFFKHIVLKYIDFPNKDKLEPSFIYKFTFFILSIGI